jgi:hypothetical protein
MPHECIQDLNIMNLTADVDKCKDHIVRQGNIVSVINDKFSAQIVKIEEIRDMVDNHIEGSVDFRDRVIRHDEKIDSIEKGMEKTIKSAIDNAVLSVKLWAMASAVGAAFTLAIALMKR